MVDDAREAALRRFRRRAMLVLYPLSGTLLIGAVFFRVFWNLSYALVWRPAFERRFPQEHP